LERNNEAIWRVKVDFEFVVKDGVSNEIKLK